MTTSQTPALNEGQASALAAIESWLEGPFNPARPFFVLRGYAGTGKTFLMRLLKDRIKGRVIFTAPTNKATKVLRDTMTEPEYRPECKTIYSLLGLSLSANGEVKELVEPEDPVDLSKYKLVVVDEGSMTNATICQHIRKASDGHRLRFLFLGDPAQLPPVKEQSSPIWQSAYIPDGDRAELTQVMRHDNQILTLVTRIRGVVDHPAPKVTLASDADPDNLGGVLKVSPLTFRKMLHEQAKLGAFQRPGEAKVIAWRNVTVDDYNKLIRAAIFEQTIDPWVVGDRVIFTEPARDVTDAAVDDDKRKLLASTDDEGTVTRVSRSAHPFWVDFDVYNVSIQIDDGPLVCARALVPEHQQRFMARTERLAQEARIDRKKWPDFWEFKESFHSIRHAYAITAHRSQGSTYKTAFVDYLDILHNPRRNEAFRCLYVAASRPAKLLVLGG